MKKYPHGLTLNAVCAAIDDYQRHEDSAPEEGILAAFNTLLGHSDIAEALRSMERTADVNMAAAQAMRDDMYHWKQRAEAAEAKLAEMEKQPPVGKQYRVSAKGNNSATGWSLWHDGDGDQYKNSYDVEAREVFSRPATAINLAELVPSKLEEKEGDYQSLRDEKRGYNACIAAILRNIEEAK